MEIKRYSTFSAFALDVMTEVYAISGFPTKDERQCISEIIGETEKRVQAWFKGRRKTDRNHSKEPLRGDISELLRTLQKTRSVFQLQPTSKKRRRILVDEETAHNNVKETLRILMEEPHMTQSVWPNPPPCFGAPSLSSGYAPFSFPALASAFETPSSKSPSNETGCVSFTPELTESSILKSNIRIRDPFQDDPTPTKKKRKLDSDVTYSIPSIGNTMEDIYNMTSTLLPHIDNFLWGMETPRYT
ncbi:uncharacterized protein LOC133192841 [Saccostrea echinata]|uniref:uncharacterized protein LOC133192841 n=1 Tax=Saccostrea echinata TaxID=191078 RepID=UPI002A840061|nr:uncharacterized protein LOC133192841 [Saccostrea echinata]